VNNQNLMTALVIDTNDPEKQGRVRLSLPALPDGPELWARVVSPLAGSDRGHCFLPEIDDEVLVAFAQGDLSTAYVLGGLWSKEKLPPEGIGAANDIKMIKTSAGHTVMLNDTKDEESITIIDKNENSIVIATSDNCITLTSQSKLTIQADKDVTIKGNKIKLEADSVEIKSKSSLVLDGGNSAELKASAVNIN